MSAAETAPPGAMPGIGRYRMGFEIESHGASASLLAFIDYDLPVRRRWLVRLADFYESSYLIIIK